jgi:(1->4)-alpha-D-glucan 1-alpha-D-glucosylmutase
VRLPVSTQTMPRIPTSSYRLQLHAGFTFADACRILPYLKALGISHVYCSPYMQAAKGSMHGYDVVDQQQVNQELGGEEAHLQFVHTLKELDLGQLLDIVPNHMATGPGNRFWWDVLENGPSSRFAEWFDIDWNSAEVKLQNKVLIPVLGDQYGHVLNKHEIAVQYDGEGFTVHYYDHVFPLAPRSLVVPLSTAARYINVQILNFISDSLARLPSPDTTDEDVQAARHRDKTILYDLLKRACKEEPDVLAAIIRAIDEINRNVDALDTLLNLQNYRLAYWRTADQELGYRRFFDVNTLIGVRVERQRVFNATHLRVLAWLKNGDLDGVRVDHPDGLRDPEQYFERLRASAPQAWILAEKILQPNEFLRPSWPIAGTTGYDFMNVCNQALVNGEGLTMLAQIYSHFTGQSQDFDSLVHSKKLNVQHEALAADVNRLTQLFVEICENNRDRRDYTRAEIRRAIREVAASFSVYRTYVAPPRNTIVDEDAAQIRNAVEIAKTQRADIDADLFDFIADVLALRSRGELETEFLERFQQFTSPVMAKGVEDTMFYCYNRMVGLNEVGGAPECNGIDLDKFHSYFAKLQSEHPKTMNSLSTHDTKRSEDVRARLAVLTEIPSQWRSTLHRWSRRNQPFKTGAFPDRNTEYFLYQTLIGAWPIGIERITAYMEKAAREAKEHTSWTLQNKEFEDALKLFIERLYASQEFTGEVDSFVAGIISSGRINSLAQTLIKCTAPGVPDAYQGSEIWDLRLVDPDNRGNIDYEQRQSLLAEIQAGIGVEDIVKKMDSGLPKLWLIYKSLQLRREHPEWFGEASDYIALPVEGSKQAHLIAFRRGDAVAVLAPRWNLKLAGVFGATTVELPAGRWTNILTGEILNGEKMRAQNLFHRFPVALLVKDDGVIDAAI